MKLSDLNVEHASAGKLLEWYYTYVGVRKVAHSRQNGPRALEVQAFLDRIFFRFDRAILRSDAVVGASEKCPGAPNGCGITCMKGTNICDSIRSAKPYK